MAFGGFSLFLVTPDEQLRDLSPIEALKRGDPDLEAVTLRLARGKAGSDGFA